MWRMCFSINSCVGVGMEGSSMDRQQRQSEGKVDRKERSLGNRQSQERSWEGGKSNFG